jgi:hypothetical protein
VRVVVGKERKRSLTKACAMTQTIAVSQGSATRESRRRRRMRILPRSNVERVNPTCVETAVTVRTECGIVAGVPL